MAPSLEAIGIYKTYPEGTVANDGVNLFVQPGEVHAVIGENGAGKSTLMKILFGVEQPDRGELRLNGNPVRFSNPRDAIAAGVGMVFQHFSLVPSFSVYENVVLGSEPHNGFKFDREKAIESVCSLSKEFRLNVNPMSRTGSLSVGEQQRVEILKALYRNAQLLILDEPTAVLAPQEITELFAAIRSLVRQGRTVIFIAHKLPEVLRISDAITIMRAGKTIGRVRTRDATEQDLATRMVGREVALHVDRAVTDQSEVLCRVHQVKITDNRGGELCAGIDLNVHAGEIVGLVGVEGNGQAELMEAVAGLRPVAQGQIFVKGENIVPFSILQRRARGLALIPEDRIASGLATSATIAENLIATKLDDPRYVWRGLLNRGTIHNNAEKLIARFSISAGGPNFAVGTLSGGNMQKVVVARELSEQPNLLLVSQPTRGVDLGATQFIWRAITDARDAGAAVILSSADLSELLALSDRLVVFYRGQIVAAYLNSMSVTAELLGTHMLGLAHQTPDEMKAGLT